MEYKLIWQGEASEVEKHLPHNVTWLYGGDQVDLMAIMRYDVELYVTQDRRNYAIDRSGYRIAELEV